MTHARRPAEANAFRPRRAFTGLQRQKNMPLRTCARRHLQRQTLFVPDVRSQVCKGKKIRRRGRMPMGLYRLKSVSTVFFQRADFCADKAAVNLFFGLNFNAVRASISRPVLCSALSCCRKANNAEKVSCFCSLGMSSFSSKKYFSARGSADLRQYRNFGAGG